LVRLQKDCQLINNELSAMELLVIQTFLQQKGKPINIIALNELFEDDKTSLAAQKKRLETTRLWLVWG